MKDKKMIDERRKNGWMTWGCCLLLICVSIIFSSFIVLPAFALSPLVADLSNYRINIDSGFNGTRLFLFGARNDAGDIVVVMRGPSKNYMVRKKEEIAGIWVNRERMKFFNVPDFYAIASSKPLADIEQTNLFKRLGIGQDTLLTASKSQGNFAEFSEAFQRYQLGRKLYMQAPEKVSFMGETLFKTVVEFPDNIPPGDYTAEIYLISGGEIAGMQSTPVKVVKSGVDEFVYAYAHNSPAMYGITAIFLALLIGWFGGKMFERL